MNILVSACLLGVGCRYDGKSKPNKSIIELISQHNLIPFCPEVYGGLSTPRPPAEIADGLVKTSIGRDVTAEYKKGAEEALNIAKLFNCDMAILKERSPSCGNGEIYDGSFSGTLNSGDGITAALLKKNGIRVLGESDISELSDGDK